MALPEFADQKREQERKGLKVLLSRTLLASLVLHAGLLPLNFQSLWATDEPAPEEIAIVVTDSEEPEVEEPLEPLDEETEVLAGSDGGGGSSASAPVETIEATALPEPIQPEPDIVPPQPVAVAEPSVEPSPQPEEPSTEPSSEPTEQTVAPTAETPVAPSPAPQRNIRDLLERLRRDRAATQQQNAGSGTSETNNTAAVGTPGLPSGIGTGSGSGSGSGTGSGSGNGSGPGSGAGSGSGNESGSGRGSGAGTDRGAGSGTPETNRDQGEGRRIACRDCPDVDYPEEALREDLEGTVKVLVDYDEDGNVVGATLVDSSGHTVLDEAVLETVREKYRLNDSGGAGSTVLSVDMTIGGSDFNRQAEERGDRRAVDIPPPAPIAEEPVPSDTAAESILENEAQSTPSDSAIPTSPSPTPTPPALTPSSEPAAEVTPPAATPGTVPEAVPEVIPEAVPETLPEPVPEPVPEPPESDSLPPEPAYEAPPEPAAVEPVYVEPAPALEPEPAAPPTEALPPVEP